MSAASFGIRASKPSNWIPPGVPPDTVNITTAFKVFDVINCSAYLTGIPAPPPPNPPKTVQGWQGVKITAGSPMSFRIRVTPADVGGLNGKTLYVYSRYYPASYAPPTQLLGLERTASAVAGPTIFTVQTPYYQANTGTQNYLNSGLISGVTSSLQVQIVSVNAIDVMQILYIGIRA